MDLKGGRPKMEELRGYFLLDDWEKVKQADTQEV